MAWFRTRREIAQLRKQVAQLTAAISQLHQPHGFDAGQFLASLMDGQVKQVGSMTEFMRMISEVAAERSAAALGRKGGRKRAATAQRDERGRMLPRAKQLGPCRLCDDPMIADFTLSEWEAHQSHKGARRAAPAPETIELRPEPQPEPQPDPRRYPLPHVAYGDTDRGADVHGAEGQPPSTNGIVSSDVS